MRNWRHSLLDYLTTALEAGQLSAELSRLEQMKLFEEHQDRLWNVRFAFVSE